MFLEREGDGGGGARRLRVERGGVTDERTCLVENGEWMCGCSSYPPTLYTTPTSTDSRVRRGLTTTLEVWNRILRAFTLPAHEVEAWRVCPSVCVQKACVSADKRYLQELGGELCCIGVTELTVYNQIRPTVLFGGLTYNMVMGNSPLPVCMREG